MSSRFSTSRPIVCLITEGGLTPSNFRENKQNVLVSVGRAAGAGISFVQIREKSLSAAMLCELVGEAVDVVSGSSTRILVNDRADVAAASGAAGVHLTSNSMPVASVRRSFGADFVIGVSAHEQDEVQHAAAAGADFAFFGPVFSTPGKGAAVGVDELRRVADAAGSFPVLGLGGVSATNFRDVCAVSAGFAAIRFLGAEAGIRSVAEFLKYEG